MGSPGETAERAAAQSRVVGRGAAHEAELVQASDDRVEGMGYNNLEYHFLKDFGDPKKEVARL